MDTLELKPNKPCADCGRSIEGRSVRARFCIECSKSRSRKSRRATTIKSENKRRSVRGIPPVREGERGPGRLYDSICSIDGCDKKHLSRGLCSTHYERLRNNGTTEIVSDRSPQRGKQCSGPDCYRPAESRGLCNAHYEQKRRTGKLWKLNQHHKPTGRFCRGPTCTRKPHARGLCEAHYHQWSEGGDFYLRPLGSTRRFKSKSCKGCGIVFQPNSGMNWYCSGLCKRDTVNKEHRKPQVETRCAVCDGAIMTSYVRENNYCGDSCCRVAETARNRERRKRGQYKEKPKKIYLCKIEGCDKQAKSFGLCVKHREIQDVGEEEYYTRKNVVRPVGFIRTNTDGYCDIKTGPRKWERHHRIVMSRSLDRSLLGTEEVHHKNGDRSDNRIENLELWSVSQPPGQRVLDKIKWAHGILKTYSDFEEVEKCNAPNINSQH